jgi:hypothetical protein
VRAIVVSMPYHSYLILNESTLFYFDLSTPKTSQAGKVIDWTADVAKANKGLKSKVPDPSTATSTTFIPTDRTTTSSSAVVSQGAFTTKKKKPKLEPKAENMTFSTLLIDEDESAERDAALNSPIKGKKRLTTKVRCSKS